MMYPRRYGATALLAFVLTGVAAAQGPARPTARESHGTVARSARDTTVTASRRYGASGVHRFLLGANYRDLWAAPITVPVLDLGRFGGGLTPLKEGGNAQTRNLHLRGGDGKEYVFRPIYKEVLELPDEFRKTVVAQVFADGLSASHPAATVMAPAFMEAAGVLHPDPQMAVMPDDERLGEFRGHFAGKLGTIEVFPEDPEHRRGFGGAVDVIDSEDLLENLNESPATRVDAHALLTARLVDMVIGDNDRHPGQWKWARLREDSTAPWIPIPRDRDKAFVSYEGALLSAARWILPNLVTFRHTHPRALFVNALEFDRRLLAPLDRADFDSTARFLARAFTDSVIESAVRAMPAEYQRLEPDLTSRIRARRNELPSAAMKYYGSLFHVADLHASDAAEHATVERHDDGTVDVTVRYAGRVRFTRRFLPSETAEVRLYLHGGDDTTVVTGASGGMMVRVIGGNGSDVLTDQSRSGAHTRFYELDGPEASRDDSTGYDPDTAWNQRPAVRVNGQNLTPIRDYGVSLSPTFRFRTESGMGIIPLIGVKRVQYGFRQYPYASRMSFEVGYSTALAAWEARLRTDVRRENSRLFWTTETEATQLMSGRFSGFGNQVALPDEEDLTRVRRTQYRFQPAVAWSVTPVTELSIGPVIKYTATDSVRDHVIAGLAPYGFPRFGQAGIVVTLAHESTRQAPHVKAHHAMVADEAARGFTLDVSAAAYPAMLDARSAFGSVAAVATAFHALPLPLTPVLAVRAGGQQVFGEYPYFEAAYLGGTRSLRSVHRQRYAGDASLYGSAELRVPIARFGFILPWDTGVFGFVDAGRVYVDGASPGGWHTGTGGGLWIGVLRSSTSLTVTFTNSRERKILYGLGFAY